MARLFGQTLLLLLLLTGLCTALNVYTVLPPPLLEKCWLLLLPLTSLGGCFLYGRQRRRAGGGVWGAAAFCGALLALLSLAPAVLSPVPGHVWPLIIFGGLAGEGLGRAMSKKSEPHSPPQDPLA